MQRRKSKRLLTVLIKIERNNYFTPYVFYKNEGQLSQLNILERHLHEATLMKPYLMSLQIFP